MGLSAGSRILLGAAPVVKSDFLLSPVSVKELGGQELSGPAGRPGWLAYITHGPRPCQHCF